MDPSNSALFKTDDALKILTPWWDFVLKLIAVFMMATASISIAMQISQDGLVCVAAVRCSAVNTSSLVNSCKSAPLDKHQHSNVTILTSFNKDLQMSNFLNSLCFHSLDTPYSGFVAVILFGESLVLLAVCYIWTMYPKSLLTLNQFVSLVTECYEADGTDEDIISVLTNGKAVQEDGNGKADEIAQKAKIKTTYDKVEKFCKMQIKRKSLIRVYRVQLCLQAFFSLAFLALLIIHLSWFGSFQFLFKCTDLSLESNELLSVAYDYIRCSRNAQLVSFFNVVTWVFVFLIGCYLVITIVAVIIVFRCCCCCCNLKKLKIRLQQGARVDNNVDIESDLSLLCFLLKQHNELQYNSFILFYSKEKAQPLLKPKEIKKLPAEERRS